jgi:hypothetical protein
MSDSGEPVTPNNPIPNDLPEAPLKKPRLEDYTTLIVGAKCWAVVVLMDLQLNLTTCSLELEATGVFDTEHEADASAESLRSKITNKVFVLDTTRVKLLNLK